MSQPNKTRVQVATDPAFSNVVYDVNGAYDTSLQIAESELPVGVNLYARGMHGHPDTGDSNWSTAVQFKILALWEDWDGSNNGVSFLFDTDSYYPVGTEWMYGNIYASVIRKADNYLYINVLKIEGTVVNHLNTVKTYFAGYYDPTLVAVDTNKAVVTYGTSYNSTSIFTFKINEDYTVTIGRNTVLFSHDRRSSTPTCAKVDTGRFIVGLQYDSNVWYGWLYVGSVDESLTITKVSSISFGTGVYTIKIRSIDQNRLLVTYRHYNGTLYGGICSLSGTSMVMGQIVSLASIPSDLMPRYILTIDIDKVLMFYYLSGTLCVRILSISGNTITISDPYVLCGSVYNGCFPAIKVDENVILVQYTDSSTNKVMIAKLRIDGGLLNRINSQEEDIFIDDPATRQSTYFKFTKIDSNRVLLNYGLYSINSTRVKVISR